MRNAYYNKKVIQGPLISMRILRGNISLLNPVKFLKLMTLSRLLNADQFFVAIKQALYHQRKYFCLVLRGWD